MCGHVHTDPKVLPCLHCYCKSCLQEKSRLSRTVTCPECNQGHKLDERSIEKLPSGITAIKTIALHSIAAQRALQNAEMECELCNSPSGAQAHSYCQHCMKYLCLFCEEAHERLKPYANHVVLKKSEIPALLEDLGSPSPSSPSPSSSSGPVRLDCPDHDEELKMHCFDCDTLVCRQCTKSDHRGHCCDYIRNAAEKIRENLKSEKESLEINYKLLEERKSRIQDRILNAQNDGLDATEFVNRAFDVVLKQFEKYRANLLQSIRLKVASETHELQRRSRDFELVQTALRPLIILAKHNLDSASREEMMSAHKRLTQQVTDIHNKCQERLETQVLQGEPFKVYKTSCARIIGAIGDSLKSADPIMCFVEDVESAGKRPEVGRETSLILRMNQTNDAPCTAIQNVEVELTAMDADSQECEVNVEMLHGSAYRVSYTPKVQGQHILKVRVNERPILGNPFHILVKRPLKLVKEPILIIRGVKKLHDLALHRNGNLIGTQSENGMVVSMDRKGKSMRPLLTGVGQAFGIATNQHGWVFLSHNKKCSLQKYSKGMKLEKTTGCKDGSLGNFNKPGRLAINKSGEIFVCDVKNSRVQVFDDDLDYLRWYSVSKPTGIAMDSEGDLYVAESGKNSLCKIFVASKLGKVTLREELSDPQGVYIDKDYIYVAERGSGQVSVLDHDGEFVTALGRGILKSPGGIVGDDDGYLYVCDEELEAICVF